MRTHRLFSGVGFSRFPLALAILTLVVGALSFGLLGFSSSNVVMEAVPFDQVFCSGEAATIVGSRKDDLLIGTEGADVIHGLSGNDLIYGLEGNDILCGGAGNDEIHGGDGADDINGQAGDDDLDHGCRGRARRL